MECAKCDFKGSNILDLNIHVQNTHINFDRSKFMFNCRDCGQESSDTEDLIEDINKEHCEDPLQHVKKVNKIFGISSWHPRQLGEGRGPFGDCTADHILS